MAEQDVTGGLSPAEQAFFDSKGEVAVAEPVTEKQDGKGQEEGRLQAEVVKADEGQGEPVKAEPARDEKGRFVPHGAFHAERVARKAAEGSVADLTAQLAELRRTQETLNQRFQQYQSPLQQEQPDFASDIPPDDDPVAQLAWIKGQIVQARQASAQQQQQSSQQAQHESQINSIVLAADNAFREAEHVDPEVTEAYSYAKESFANELRAIGTPEHQIQTRLQEIAQRFALTAMQNGMHPADLAKNVAMSRGWRPKTQQKADPATIEMPDKLKEVEQALQGAKTIGQSNGRAGGDALTPEAVAAMPEHEFAVWMKSPENQRRFNQMMRG